MRFTCLFILCCWLSNSQAQMSDTSLLIGKIELKNIKEYSWYAPSFNEYIVDQNVIDSLKPYADDIKIMAIIGTWCSDSKEHIPALFKIIEQADIQTDQIELIGVDRKKHCPFPNITELNIEYVPTLFIFYKGKLVGKIIETPTHSIEADMLELLMENK
jgi:hypothetical protein